MPKVQANNTHFDMAHQNCETNQFTCCSGCDPGGNPHLYLIYNFGVTANQMLPNISAVHSNKSKSSKRTVLSIMVTFTISAKSIGISGKLKA